VASYWVHLLATVIWLGGVALMAFIAWPALRQGTLSSNQWFRPAEALPALGQRGVDASCSSPALSR
jgi:uncharacterized membrane protein